MWRISSDLPNQRDFGNIVRMQIILTRVYVCVRFFFADVNVCVCVRVVWI